MTDIQTDRLTIIRVSSVEIGRTRNGKCTRNDTTTTRNRPCYVGHCSNRLHRRPRYMYRYIWIETSWFLMKKTDKKGNQAHRQTDRLSIIGVSSVAIGPTPHKRQRHANHTTCGNNQHCGPTTHRMGMVRLKLLSGTASTLICIPDIPRTAQYRPITTTDFKFFVHVDHSQSQPMDDKLSMKGAWSILSDLL